MACSACIRWKCLGEKLDVSASRIVSKQSMCIDKSEGNTNKATIRTLLEEMSGAGGEGAAVKQRGVPKE